MASNQLITLITGGNSGIGKCLAGLLLEDSKRHVIITSRSSDKGEAAVKELRALGNAGTIEVLPLDVNKPDSIAALAKEVESKYGRLDALVNNAAVGTFPDGTPLFDRMQESFKSNVTGPAVMLEQFWPLLQKSKTTPRIINHSSGAGSNTIVVKMKGWPHGELPVPYFTSKAALNMLGSCFIASHAEDNFKLFTYAPGFTESNLGPNNKTDRGAKPTVEGARPMVSLLSGDRDDEHGCFINFDGTHHGW